MIDFSEQYNHLPEKIEYSHARALLHKFCIQFKHCETKMSRANIEIVELFKKNDKIEKRMILKFLNDYLAGVK